MIDTHSVWVFIHILLLVYWLGADLGVFLLANGAKNASLSFDQRAIMMKYAMLIDFVPRMTFVAMFPVGLHMSADLGLVSVSNSVFALVWAVAVIWLAVVVLSHAWIEKPIGQKLQKILFGWQTLLFVGLTGLGLYSMAAGAPFATTWLSLKIFLFGLIFGCAIGLDVTFAPVVPAFERLATEGSTPEIESQISRAVNRADFFVLSLYALLVVIAFIGVTKPF